MSNFTGVTILLLITAAWGYNYNRRQCNTRFLVPQKNCFHYPMSACCRVGLKTKIISPNCCWWCKRIPCASYGFGFVHLLQYPPYPRVILRRVSKRPTISSAPTRPMSSTTMSTTMTFSTTEQGSGYLNDTAGDDEDDIMI